jgi:hypothetical protein
LNRGDAPYLDLEARLNTDDFLDLVHISRQSVGNGLRALFAPPDKYPQATNVYQIYQLWDCGFTRFSISYEEENESVTKQNTVGDQWIVT